MLVKGLILSDLGLRLNTAYSWKRPRIYFSAFRGYNVLYIRRNMMKHKCVELAWVQIAGGNSTGACRDLSRNDGVLRMN